MLNKGLKNEADNEMELKLLVSLCGRDYSLILAAFICQTARKLNTVITELTLVLWREPNVSRNRGFCQKLKPTETVVYKRHFHNGFSGIHIHV